MKESKIERQNRILLAAELVLAKANGELFLDGVITTRFSCTAIGVRGDTLREEYSALFHPDGATENAWLNEYLLKHPEPLDTTEWRLLALLFFREMQ